MFTTCNCSLSPPPQSTKTAGLRPMERRDIRQVTELLQRFLRRFQLAPSMSDEEVAHWLLPQENIIDTYVIEVAAIRSSVENILSICGGDKKFTYRCSKTTRTDDILFPGLVGGIFNCGRCALTHLT